MHNLAPVLQVNHIIDNMCYILHLLMSVEISLPNVLDAAHVLFFIQCTKVRCSSNGIGMYNEQKFLNGDYHIEIEIKYKVF